MQWLMHVINIKVMRFVLDSNIQDIVQLQPSVQQIKLQWFLYSDLKNVVIYWY